MSNATRILLADGEHIDVQTNLFDQAAFERALRNNRSWGSLADNAMRMQAFRAWHAAKRQGLLDLAWEQFYESPDTPVIAVVPAPEDEDDDEDGLEVEGLGEDMLTAQ